MTPQKLLRHVNRITDSGKKKLLVVINPLRVYEFGLSTQHMLRTTSSGSLGICGALLKFYQIMIFRQIFWNSVMVKLTNRTKCTVINWMKLSDDR